MPAPNPSEPARALRPIALGHLGQRRCNRLLVLGVIDANLDRVADAPRHEHDPAERGDEHLEQEPERRDQHGDRFRDTDPRVERDSRRFAKPDAVDRRRQ
jgi:hypothetical protein